MFIKTFKGSITNWNKNVLLCYKREQIICTLKPSSSTGNKEVKPRSSLKSFFATNQYNFWFLSQLGGKMKQMTGKVGESIIETSKVENADLIIVGTRGMSKVRRTFLGSVSDYLVHHANVPVLVCRHKEFDAQHDRVHHHHHHRWRHFTGSGNSLFLDDIFFLSSKWKEKENALIYCLFVVHNKLKGKIINEVHCKSLCDFRIDVYMYSVYASLYFLRNLIVTHTCMTGQKSTQSKALPSCLRKRIILIFKNC